MSIEKEGYTWPFRWNAKTKIIRNKMRFWCEGVKDKPISLSPSDYEELMNTLPSNYIKIASPMFDGREIKKSGRHK